MKISRVRELLETPFDSVSTDDRRDLRSYYRFNHKKAFLPAPARNPLDYDTAEIAAADKKLSTTLKHLRKVRNKLIVLGFVFRGVNDRLGGIAELADSKYRKPEKVSEHEWNAYCEICASNPYGVYAVGFKTANAQLTQIDRLIKWLTDEARTFVHSIDHPMRERALGVLKLYDPELGKIPAFLDAVREQHRWKG